MVQHRLPLLAILLASSGCGESVACTLVGMESGVGVRPADSIELTEFCLEDDCQTGRPQGNFVGTQSDDPSSYRYVAHITLADGRPLQIDGVVTTDEFFANGPNCAPRTANATLIIDDSGSVSVTVP